MNMRGGYRGYTKPGLEETPTGAPEERQPGSVGLTPPQPVDTRVFANPHERSWGGYQDERGAELDVNRYRDMARPGTAAPVIDQTRSDETRGIQDRGIGYLGDAATGRTSFARDLGQRQLAGAMNAQRSLAATVRGGPMARAAAMRNANREAGGLEARGRLGYMAGAAAEEAGARGAYAGALQGQRGQDLGLATSQAGLEVGQRGANDQREGFYEGLAWDTRNAQMNAELGTSAATISANNADRNAAAATDKASREAVQTAIGAGVGGVVGGIQGITHATPGKPDDRYGGSGTSDIKAKTDVRNVDSLKKRANDAIDTARAGVEAGPYLGSGVSKPDGIGKEALDAAIGKRVEEDAGPRYGYFDENQKPAPPEWLAGYMNSPDQLTLSDDKAKLAEAWDQGHAAAIADVEKAGRARPEEIKRRSEGDDYNPAHAAVRGIKGNAWEEGHKEGDISARMKANRQKMERDFEEAGKDAPVGPATPKPEPMATDIISTREQLYGGKPTPAAPGYVDQLLGRAKAFISPRMTSDERAKESKGYHPGAMADAMRSMKPSVYEYKPEYAGRAGQDVGEKNVGPMANNMERDRVASTAIERQPDGMLAIDKDKALKLTMGGLADLQMQIDQLKGRKGRAA